EHVLQLHPFRSKLHQINELLPELLSSNEPGAYLQQSNRPSVHDSTRTDRASKDHPIFFERSSVSRNAFSRSGGEHASMEPGDPGFDKSKLSNVGSYGPV